MSIYVSDIIGDDYKSWKPRNKILLCTQTGSGKTTFILKNLLSYAAQNNKYLVYICNRRILKSQNMNNLIEENVNPEYRDHIIITTYQYYETSKQYPNFKEDERDIFKEDVTYYVFDEAHYFIQDSLFNVNTNYWKKALSSINSSSNVSDPIYVFITATPEPLKCFLMRFSKCYELISTTRNFYDNINEYRKNINNKSKDLELYNPKDRMYHIIKEDIKYAKQNKTYFYEYFNLIYDVLHNNYEFSYITPVEIDYSYITTYYFNDYNDLTDIILSDNKKWLIFVDNEAKGEEYYHILIERGIDASFISSPALKKDLFSANSVFEDIVKEQNFKCRVLIATSVMDCGINIIDSELLNIVIANMDKTTFLQMLGRIRIDTQKINLYIKNYDNSTINYYRNLYERFFIGLNEMEMLWEFGNFTNSHPYDAYALISNRQAEVILSKIQQLKVFFPLTYDIKWYRHNDYKASKKILELEYEPNITGSIKVLYFLYELDRIFRIKNKDITTDRNKGENYIYLKEQLSWVQQQYDKTHWVNYYNYRNDLCNFIENYMVKDGISQEEQIQFSRGCEERMAKLPDVPIKIKYDNNKIQRDPFFYRGKKFLNEELGKMEIPYKITSKQVMRKRVRERLWYITRVTPDSNIE